MRLPRSPRRWRPALWTLPALLVAGAAGWAVFGRSASPPENVSTHPATGDTGRRVNDTTLVAAPTPVVTASPTPPKADSQRGGGGGGGTPHRVASRRQTAAPAPADSGVVQINSQPVATVRVDGRLVGTTPIPSLKLSIGEPHRVRLAQDGFVPVDTVITLRPGEQLKKLTNFILKPVRP